MKLESFKNSIDNIKPDPYMETRLAQNVLEAAPKKRSKRKLAIAAVSGFLSLAVLITGLGFGGLWRSPEIISPAPSTNSPASDELGVLVAYAATEEFLGVDSVGEQDLFYGIYVAPINDEEAAKERYQKDYEEIERLAKQVSEKGYQTVIGTRCVSCWNEAEELTAYVYDIRASHFALDLDDYSEVKTFKVENSGIYGRLLFTVDRPGKPATSPFGFSFEVSGDELRENQEYYTSESGKDSTMNKGYRLDWKPSDKLYESIGNDPNFDLSKVKDTIKFTVEFNDGTVKTGRLDLYFDSDGYMHFGK